MSGNAWEWTSEAFRIRSLNRSAQAVNDRAREENRELLKGGSYLCHISYCYRYRIAARTSNTPDTATVSAIASPTAAEGGIASPPISSAWPCRASA